MGDDAQGSGVTTVILPIVVPAFPMVVPAQAGTHNHRPGGAVLNDESVPLGTLGVGVPACAGTTC
jgi:hypothetical protein